MLKRIPPWSVMVAVLVVAGMWAAAPKIKPLLKGTPTPTATRTATLTPSPTFTLAPTDTTAPTDTATAGPTPTDTETPTETATPTDTPVPSPTPVPVDIAPYQGAPLCPDVGALHDNTLFHTLWDGVRGCHYDHEHGANPFTPDVAAAFPGFSLFDLLGGVGVGHTNPSSPMENTMKHGGFKWQVQPLTPHGCDNRDANGQPFEGAQYGVRSAVVQYHNFGDYSIEAESRIHSAALLVAVCNWASPSDVGYMYVVQFEDYGQRIVPYQGTIVGYPNQPVPAYQPNLGPYLSMDCVNGGVPQCRASRAFALSLNLNVNSIWTSQPTGNNSNFPGDKLFKLLFRIRDVYQLFDWNDQTYPFTFVWMCSADGGLTYNPLGCRWNNSTTRVHEIAGTVPAEWDNLPGFDTDPAAGRITAEGYVTRFGDLNTACTEPSVPLDCFPVKMVNMPVGTYGDALTAGKVSNPDVTSNPERDIYFCPNGLACQETDPGAVPSGWIGPSN